MKTYSGGCVCGAVRFEARGEPDRVGLCHCVACRKHHGALFHASAVYREDAVAVSGPYKTHDTRSFCPVCGSSVFSQSPGEIELHLGAFDERDVFVPTYELWTIRREKSLPAFKDMTLFDRDRT